MLRLHTVQMPLKRIRAKGSLLFERFRHNAFSDNAALAFPAPFLYIYLRFSRRRRLRRLGVLAIPTTTKSFRSKGSPDKNTI